MHKPKEDRWIALAGAIDPPKGTENVNKIVANKFVGDTGDGGAAPFMTRLGGRDVPSYKARAASEEQISNADLIKMAKSAESLPALDKDAMLTAECRCGGVLLRIKRADHKATSTPAVFTPPENDKYPACACVCRDCRLHQGVTTAFWLYVPYSSVINPHTDQPVAHRDAAQTEKGRSTNQGLKLTHYVRSGNDYDAYRAFCSTCGASILYDFSDRPDVTNIAAGLVMAEDGIMARRWLSWEWGVTAHKDSYTDREVRDAWMAAEGTEGIPQL